MIETSEALVAALDDFGAEFTVNGGPGTITAIPHLDGETLLNGEYIERTGPFAIAKKEDVDALGLAAGNQGSTLTINATGYTLLAIDPDGQGGVVLGLLEM
ncbi:MAG: hypothetical protein AB7U29_03480 [Desulfobulbus sp.]